MEGERADQLEGLAGAWRLSGLELDSGWRIVAPMGWDPKEPFAPDHYGGTGGHFSVAYVVEKDGKKAFLKAIDFTMAMESPNITATLEKILSEHKFETEILEICAGERMNRVVVAIESGQVRVGPNTNLH